jgi:predicted small lipoprotein YifL
MRMCWSQWLLLAVVIALGSLTLLSGCGKRGKLYLPQEQVSDAPQTEQTDDKKPKKAP